MIEKKRHTTMTWAHPDRSILMEAARHLGTTFGAFVRTAAAIELQRIAEIKKDDPVLQELAQKHELARRYSS